MAIVILDKISIQKAIIRISHEILEKNKKIENIVIIGIKERGDILAKRIANCINQIEKAKISIGSLDITFYRDDIDSLNYHPKAHSTNILFDIKNKDIILVDDVLFAGRTIRAALDALIDLGRPKTIQLAVLIDRGHRELPIKADYIGKSVPTSKKEIVEVFLEEIDNEDKVIIKKEE
ncbi:MAG: bifunctional pyr operon transcriptional regulator/uracil phosphoribosyltransferase PyrR [bacterium]